MSKPIKIVVTGAAGQIGYSLLFRLASGELFGPNQKVHLNLLELKEAIKGAEGTAMELDDCAFPTLAGVDCYDNADDAFFGVSWALLVGSKPRGPGMERSDLIKANGPIFIAQGKALARASSDVRVVVVGNPCNTNALIAQHHCREIPATRFSAMTALDENRAKAQLAKKTNCAVEDIEKLVIWGNHSTTMFPNFEHGTIKGKPIEQVVNDRSWLEKSFMEIVQKRGAAVIEARGKSSAASAASSCIDHMRNLSTKTKEGQWFSAAVPTDGSMYDVPQGLIFSFPLRADGKGNYEIVKDLKLSDYAKSRIKVTADELLKEREIIKDLL